MSIFSRIKEYFTPKIIFVWRSELSHPTECERKFDKEGNDELYVLRILQNKQMKACDIDKLFHSGGRRANDLYHQGYLDNLWNKRVFVYSMNDRGYDLLLELETKWKKQN